MDACEPSDTSSKDSTESKDLFIGRTGAFSGRGGGARTGGIMSDQMNYSNKDV